MEDYRARLVEIYNKKHHAPARDRLLSWLETTDFFTALPPPLPRRLQYSLVMHSLNVYDAMIQHFTPRAKTPSYTICALLHDLCQG